MKTEFKYFFLPLFFILSIQFFSLFFDFYTPRADIYNRVLVMLNYMSVFFSIITYIYIANKFNVKFGDSNKIVFFKPAKIAAVLIAIIFISISFKIYGYSLIVGYENIRYEFFYNQNFRVMLFGGLIFDWMFNIFLLPFCWLFILMLSVDKKYNFYFYLLLISLLLYSVSVGGRFSIYYAVIVLFFRYIYFNKLNIKLLVKVIFLLLVSLVFSTYILSLRTVDFDYYDSIMSVIEYHTLPPFFLINKMQDNFGNVDFVGVPFYSLFTSLLFSVLKMLKLFHGDVPYYYMTAYLNDFTLVSNYTGYSYNAFATILSFFILEFGVISPVFTFVYFLFLFSLSIFIVEKYRLSFLLFVILYSFFSFFRYEIASAGFQFMIFCLLIYSIFVHITRRVI